MSLKSSRLDILSLTCSLKLCLLILEDYCHWSGRGKSPFCPQNSDQIILNCHRLLRCALDGCCHCCCCSVQWYCGLWDCLKGFAGCLYGCGRDLSRLGPSLIGTLGKLIVSEILLIILKFRYHYVILFLTMLSLISLNLEGIYWALLFNKIKKSGIDQSDQSNSSIVISICMSGSLNS